MMLALFLFSPVPCPLTPAFSQSQPFKVANLNEIRYANRFASLPAAISDLGGPGTIMVPKGSYTISSTVSINYPMRIVFDPGVTITSYACPAFSIRAPGVELIGPQFDFWGNVGTVLITSCSGSNRNAIEIGKPDGTAVASGATVRGFSINASNSAAGANGVVAYSAQGSVIEQIIFATSASAPATGGVAVVSNQQVATGNGTQTSFTFTLTPNPLVAGGADVPSNRTLTVVAGAVTCTDNGLGHFTGSGCSGSSTVDYFNGAVTIVFTSAPANGAAITASYAAGNYVVALGHPTSCLIDDADQSVVSQIQPANGFPKILVEGNPLCSSGAVNIQGIMLHDINVTQAEFLSAIRTTANVLWVGGQPGANPPSPAMYLNNAGLHCDMCIIEGSETTGVAFNPTASGSSAVSGTFDFTGFSGTTKFSGHPGITGVIWGRGGVPTVWDQLAVCGSTTYPQANCVTFIPNTLTANRTVSLPDASGNAVLDTATQTLTNKTLGAPIITNGLDASGYAHFGPSIGNFSANSQAALSPSANWFGVLNDSSKRFGLTGLLQSSNAPSYSIGVYGVTEISANVSASAIEGDAYVTGASTGGTHSGVLGYAKWDSSGTGNISALYALTNARTAGTVTNNYGLYVADQRGVGTNNYAIQTNGGAVQVKDGAISSQLVIVSFSATPTFAASLGNTQKITLTGNVTSSTLSNASSGQQINFIICQDSTGSRTFVWPTNVPGGMTIGSTASKCNAQSFIFDGTNAYALSAGATGM